MIAFWKTNNPKHFCLQWKIGEPFSNYPLFCHGIRHFTIYQLIDHCTNLHNSSFTASLLLTCAHHSLIVSLVCNFIPWAYNVSLSVRMNYWKRNYAKLYTTCALANINYVQSLVGVNLWGSVFRHPYWKIIDFRLIEICHNFVFSLKCSIIVHDTDSIKCDTLWTKQELQQLLDW